VTSIQLDNHISALLTASSSTHITMTEETDIKKMKVSDLQHALAKRGLSTEGLKSDLINRLQTRLDEEEFGIVEAPAAGTTVSPGTNIGCDEAESSPAAEEKPAEGEHAAESSEDPASASVGIPEKGEAPRASGENIATAENSSGEASKVTAEMSFKEKMEQRAKRFGIAQQPPAGDYKKGGGAGGGKSQKQQTQRAKREQSHHESGKKREGTAKMQEQQKKAKAVEQPLLSKEEIEKRLARAKKFGTTEGVDDLKAMLRKYRFQS